MTPKGGPNKRPRNVLTRARRQGLTKHEGGINKSLNREPNKGPRRGLTTFWALRFCPWAMKVVHWAPRDLPITRGGVVLKQIRKDITSIRKLTEEHMSPHHSTPVIDLPSHVGPHLHSPIKRTVLHVAHRSIRQNKAAAWNRRCQMHILKQETVIANRKGVQPCNFQLINQNTKHTRQNTQHRSTAHSTEHTTHNSGKVI